MKHFLWSRKAAVLAALIGTTLLAAYPVPAQNPAPPPKNNNQELYERARWNLNTVVADDLANLTAREFLLAARLDPADELFGATLQPVSDALRAQLEVPAGQGLLVASLREDGPSAQAGLKQNDILLTLADKPLATADDLTKQLKAAGEAAVSLKVLRAGKPVTIQVRPNYRVTLGAVAEPKSEYFIGVSVDPVDDALRAQLALPSGQGVVISDVTSGSPAEKAGVKKYDIVLELGGKPIANFEALASQVQANRDTPTTLKLLRAGKPLTIPVSGTVRKVEASPPQEGYFRVLASDFQPIHVTREPLLLSTNANVNQQNLRFWVGATATGTEDLPQRLDRLEKELKALREALDKVSEALKATKRD
jgi:membrane-associated protease RseP (regulator of RpoE activity)